MISNDFLWPSIMYQEIFPQGMGNHYCSLFWSNIGLCIFSEIVSYDQYVGTFSISSLPSQCKGNPGVSIPSDKIPKWASSPLFPEVVQISDTSHKYRYVFIHLLPFWARKIFPAITLMPIPFLNAHYHHDKPKSPYV